ncbi:MAG: hypothetical protein ACLFQY_15340, partial [Desulfococcaceae bacterium]
FCEIRGCLNCDFYDSTDDHDEPVKNPVHHLNHKNHSSRQEDAHDNPAKNHAHHVNHENHSSRQIQKKRAESNDSAQGKG